MHQFTQNHSSFIKSHKQPYLKQYPQNQTNQQIVSKTNPKTLVHQLVHFSPFVIIKKSQAKGDFNNKSKDIDANENEMKCLCMGR